MRLTLQDLDALLTTHERITNEEWLATLSDRKRKELEFHDRDRDRTQLPAPGSDTYEKFYGNKKYYAATARSKEYVEKWLATNVPGKVFLDYACGNGKQAIAAARAGAAMSIGIDISAVSVSNARADAQAAGLSATTRFIQGDAENTRLPDGSIDVILCSGMLHHLDLSYAFPELRRILAPGGKILCVEALDYNPAIKFYRWKTPDMRTEWEAAHILSLKDVRFARRFFDVREIRYWHITSIIAPHLSFLPVSLFDAVDRVFEAIPGMKQMAWMFTFVLHKKSTD